MSVDQSARPRLHPDCQDFLDHWQSLRRGTAAPTIQEWLEHLPTRITARKFRAELLPDDAIMLFVGSALIDRRSDNMTGESMFLHVPHRRAQAWSNLRNAIGWPCGLCTDLDYPTNAGRVLVTQTIVLPISVPAGRRPQLVGYSIEAPALAPHERIVSKPVRVRNAWMDFGSGVPPHPPI